MRTTRLNDLDFLAARLHGRRSRLAEGERLEQLCRSGELTELGRAIYPESEFHAAGDFQRRLAQALVHELSSLRNELKGVGAELLSWTLVRFQIENIKVLLRGLMRRTPLGTPAEYLLTLPEGLGLDLPALASATSLEEFTERLPAGAPRNRLSQALVIYREQPRPFFVEGALDAGYFEELLTRTERLAGADRELVQPMMWQEVDAFHLMLVLRGKFEYELAPGLLLPLHVPGSRISSRRFKKMLASPDAATAAGLALRRAIDALPARPGTTNLSAAAVATVSERLAWRRFLRLANRTFRSSHMGLAAPFGYIGIRRVEVANLITVSEGLRTGMESEQLYARLLKRTDLEAVDV